MKRVFLYLAKMADVSSAMRAKKIPDSLYELCITNVVNCLVKNKCDRNELHSLPDHILMDVYFKMLLEKKLCILGDELSSLDTFERLLRFTGSQLRLLQCFQAVIEHGSKLSTELANIYLSRCDAGKSKVENLINLGLRLGGFLNEAGWYADAERVLVRCRDICQAQPQSTYYKRLTLECCHRLLNTQSVYCCFPAAAETYSLSLQLLGIPENARLDPRGGALDDTCALDAVAPHARAATSDKCCQTDPQLYEDYLASLGSPPPDDGEEVVGGFNVERCAVWGLGALVPRVLKEFSALMFVRCDYSAAHRWSLRAQRLLARHTPVKIIVEVVRTCGKACVVKRRFGAAALVVRHAVGLARAAFGPAHPRYAAALLDLGFYLLNIDSITQSVAVYEEALGTLRHVFGRSSLHVATAQEDLAYALYVLEYSSGRFYKARDHAERAIHIIENLVPPEHLLLASAKRVKALILEEIALDTPAGQDMSEPSLLEESEALHKAALNLSMMAFGEKNVQTAKHYGNLGRLYQSMQKFQDAETMHLKAIAIKEELLGPEDYEVGLSIGHLASLYNYHMNMHVAAETLYLRSISIMMTYGSETWPLTMGLIRKLKVTQRAMERAMLGLKLFGERYSGLEYDYRGLVNVFAQLKRHDRADHYTRLLARWHELRELSKAEQPAPCVGDEPLVPLQELTRRLLAASD